LRSPKSSQQHEAVPPFILLSQVRDGQSCSKQYAGAAANTGCREIGVKTKPATMNTINDPNSETTHLVYA
jgi:hypothetical protein